MNDLPPCYRCHAQPCKCKDGITLYHADCRDVLPLLEAGTVITDPVWPDATVPLPGHENPAKLWQEAWRSFPSGVRRLAVHLGCDSDPEFLVGVSARWPFFRLCSLEYVRPHYKGRLLYTGDVAYLYGDPPASEAGRRVIPGRCLPTNPNGYKSDHPCPRKPQHVRWLVKWWTEATDIVLDPFAGSGTTGRACKDLGRKCIMVEIKEKYCEIAANRLEQGVLFT